MPPPQRHRNNRHEPGRKGGARPVASRRKRNLTLLAKWACYFLILLIAATLQSLPGFLSIFGVRPLFILPVCLAVAIYEGEYPGALLAVAGGFLWDWTASRVGGLMALGLMAICFAAAVVVELYLRVNTVNFILVNAACCLLVTGMDFMFYYLMPGYSGAMERYLTTVLPMVIYTAVLSPLAMMAVRRVAGHFVPEQ